MIEAFSILTALAAVFSDLHEQSIRDRLLEVNLIIKTKMSQQGWYFGPSREARHDMPTDWHINCSWCEEWVIEAQRRVGGEDVDLQSLKVLQCQSAHKQGISIDGWFDEPQSEWSEDNWRDFEHIIDEIPAHVVLHLEGRYYDSQHPEGVQDPRDLMIVQGVGLDEYLERSSE